MKTSKCLMGVVLSSVLLIGSVFATNTLNINGISVKDGINMKVKKSIVEPEIRDACDDAGGNSAWVGDGWCDSVNNNETCNSDGGDCCPCTCYDNVDNGCPEANAGAGGCYAGEGVYDYCGDCATCGEVAAETCPDECTAGECGDGSCGFDEDCTSCPADCGECGECDAGYVQDCVDADCCPESWIGDGFEDCEDQAFGCDLTCYDNDGGDCVDPFCGDGACNGSETEADCPEDCTPSEGCTDCEFDWSAYGSECCDTAWDEFGIDCATLEGTYGWDCAGCNCPGDADPVCGDGVCNGDETYETCPDDCNAPGECDPGYITDCVDDDCCPESWIGDGFEDCEDQAYGCDLTCYDNDGGDCPEACENYTCWDGSCVDDMADCPDEPDVPEPTGVCIAGENYAGYPAVTASWNIETTCGDGLCNGDETYENCPDDCNAPGECDDGYITDCVDDDCCPESWIGDGFEDCEDQQYGCDLTCYDNDGGDCDGSTTDGGTTGGTENCDDCEFDWSAYGSECCDTAWDEYGIDCATLESTYGWDCAGCNCPGDGDPVCGDGVCNGDETYETCPDDCNAPGECDPGYITDCVDDDCCPESWIGDGFEDCEDQAYGCDLTCYDNDGGDCGPACPDGETECWDGSCVSDPADCPEQGGCAETFAVYGSDPSVGNCYSDGTGYYSFYWEGGCLATYIEYSAGGMDVTSYGFTQGFMFYGFDPGQCEDFTIVFDGGETAMSGEVCNDCAACEDGGQVTCWDGSCADTEAECPEPGDCGDGFIIDCADDDCCPESWIGDGFEDCEDQAYGCDLTCYDNDGGDCGPSESCEDQGLVECFDGTCAATEEECGSCPAGTVADCSGDGDCNFENWIGDGYCDGTAQLYGADNCCYDLDGGDCTEEECAGGRAQEASIFKKGQEPTTFAAVQHGRIVDVIRVEQDEALSIVRDGVVVHDGSQAVRMGQKVNSSSRALMATVALSCETCLYGGPWEGEWIVGAMDFGYFTVYGFDPGALVCGTVTFCEDANGACSDTSDEVCAVSGDPDSVDCVEDDGCDGAGSGDVNGDGNADVLDIVQIVNFILGGSWNNECAAEAADMNGDGNVDVLDIVQIVNGILGRSNVGDATHGKLIRSNGALMLEANGYIGGVQMTLKHGEDFLIDLTDNALVADSRTVGNETKLVIVAPAGGELFTHTGDFEIVDMIVANSEGRVNVGPPTAFSLSAAYPNPFNPTTSLTLSVPEAGNVSVQVYNIMGQVVATLASGHRSADIYTLTWDASSVSSGMYFVKAESIGNVTTQKLMLMK